MKTIKLDCNFKDIPSDGIILESDKNRYFMLPYEEYKKLELDLAYLHTLKDIKKGDFEVLNSFDDIEKHINNI
jgi:hypothetical protein